MRSLKTLLTVLGAVTVLVLAGNTVALAATGHSFILGQTNKANKITTLKRTTAGSALQVKTTSSSAAPLVVNGRGKVANLNADLLDGVDSSGFVRSGGQGAALGYAHILPNGTVDATRSWNVTTSNVASTSAGFWCFHGLSFTPHNGSLTIDYNGTSNGQIPVVLLKMPTSGADCGLASAQAEVFTGSVSPPASTSGTNTGFYVVFF